MSKSRSEVLNFLTKTYNFTIRVHSCGVQRTHMQWQSGHSRAWGKMRPPLPCANVKNGSTGLREDFCKNVGPKIK